MIARPASDGAYKFHGLPPGKFRLLAVDSDKFDSGDVEITGGQLRNVVQRDGCAFEQDRAFPAQNPLGDLALTRGLRCNGEKE